MAKAKFEESEFKQNPLAVLKRNDEDKFPFTFGVGKARMILENIDNIKAFYEKYKDKVTGKT
jgi:hypothetical protein